MQYNVNMHMVSWRAESEAWAVACKEGDEVGH